ncbi:hypothetical protein STEG23_037903 [Scotinomys teguina]
MTAEAAPYTTRTSRGSGSLHHADITRKPRPTPRRHHAAAAAYITRTSRGSGSLHHADITRKPRPIPRGHHTAAAAYTTRTLRGSRALHHTDITRQRQPTPRGHYGDAHCCTQASRGSCAQPRPTTLCVAVDDLELLPGVFSFVYDYEKCQLLAAPIYFREDMGIEEPADGVNFHCGKTKTSSTILNKYGESGKPCLVPDFSGIALSFYLV